MKRLFPLLTACVLAPAALALPQKDVLVMKDGRVFTDLDAEQQEGHVAIHLKAGTIEVADRLVDVLLEEGKDLTFVPQTDEERENFEKGLVPYEGRWERAVNARKKLEKKLKERLKNAEKDLEHKMWANAYEEETKNFNWKFTTAEQVAEQYMLASDSYFEIFAKDWKVKRNKKKPKLTINMYDTGRQFMRVSDAPRGVLGYFRFTGDYDLNVYYDRLDAPFSMYVLFHELGHYLHKLLDEDFKMPHWPGESVCEYYGAADLDLEKKKLTVGLIPNNRLATIRADMEEGKKIVLKEMITTQGFEDYTWGWSFVYMLMKDEERAENFKKFFAGLARDRKVKRVPWAFGLKTVEGDEVLRYFMECMDLEDEAALEALQEEWYTFIVEELEFEGEGAIFWEAKSARQLGEIEKAIELYRKGFKEDEKSAKAADHFALFKLIDRESKEALEHIQKAVEKAPLSAEFRWELSRALEARGRKSDEEEAAKQKALALELDPEIEDRIFDFDM